MKKAIITTTQYDGTIQVCWASYYHRKVEAGFTIESNRFNIFGDRLDDIKRTTYTNNIYLVSGEGIKTVKNETELNSLITALFLDNTTPIKVYNESQIHTIVGTKCT